MQYIERLEQRMLLAITPDVYEQYLICLINRARANPAGEAARYRVALNEGVPADHAISTTPKQPLAINVNLQQAGTDHSQWMLDANTFSHIGAGGSTPADRDLAAGYIFNSPSAWGENIAFSGQVGTLPDVMAAIERLHRNFIVDSGVDGRVHRTTMLQDSFGEIGVGLVGGDFADASGTVQAWMLTQDFAFRTGITFITGVIFADTMKRDGFYTPYEGFGQVSITATSSAGAVYSTTSWDSGGYSLQVPAGTYRLAFSGGDLRAPVVRENVVVGNANILQDVNATGMVGMPTLNTSGTLLITGTADNDHITLANLTDRIRITLNSATWDLLRKGVTRIEVRGGAGNDTIDIGPALPAARLYGEDGNDSISGGTGNDRIWAGFGDDAVDGRAGNDLIYGEDGADSLLGGDGSDTIYAGAGSDTLRGGAGGDKLRGEDGDDRIEGENGNDRITGGPGSDILIGGAGNDILNAKDTTTDRIVTGLGIDTISRDTLLDIQTTIVP